MIAKKRIGILALVLCAMFDASAQPLLDASTLSETKVLVTDVSAPSAPGKTFRAATIIGAPVKKLCAIIVDYPAYNTFMPNVTHAQVSSMTDSYALVDMTLGLPLGKIKRYRLKLEPKISQNACHLAWKLVPWEGLKVEETIADTTGYWQLNAHPSDPNKTVVEYVVFADPGPVPFGTGWVVNSMSKQSLPNTLEAVRSKAALAH